MNHIMIFYYELIEDYVFWELVNVKGQWLNRFYSFNSDGETVTALSYSPNMRFVIAVI